MCEILWRGVGSGSSNAQPVWKDEEQTQTETKIITLQCNRRRDVKLHTREVGVWFFLYDAATFKVYHLHLRITGAGFNKQLWTAVYVSYKQKRND